MNKRRIRSTGGRNNRGRITVRHRGGGQKRLERVLEYEKDGHKIEMTGVISQIEYTPNQTGQIAVCQGYKRRKIYKIVGGPEGMEVGNVIKVKRLQDAAVGESVFKVSLRAGQVGAIARAAGAGCIVIKQSQKGTVVRLPSGQVVEMRGANTCYTGKVRGKEPRVRLGKAGANRRLGVRPTVRGAAMNPVDHPNGGKTPGGQPVTP